eukprot:660430-Hanusia_phi.AAC.1
MAEVAKEPATRGDGEEEEEEEGVDEEDELRPPVAHASCSAMTGRVSRDAGRQGGRDERVLRRR